MAHVSNAYDDQLVSTVSRKRMVLTLGNGAANVLETRLLVRVASPLSRDEPLLLWAVCQAIAGPVFCPHFPA